MGMLSSMIRGICSEKGRVEPQVNPHKSETDPLRRLWKRGEGPKVDGVDVDYSYYSPVENGADPGKTYPLVVITAGALEGVVPGFELEANSLALWTAQRYQSRFHNGGAFLLIGRAQEEEKLYWDAPRLVRPFKAAIDGFIAAQPNVDRARVYTVGWCLGGTSAMQMAAAYPSFFAAAAVITPSRAFTKEEARRVSRLPLWLMGCETDNYVPFKKIVRRSRDRLREENAGGTDKLLTSCKTAPGVFLAGVIPFIQNHDMWDDLAENMRPEKENCGGLVTVDAEDRVIPTPEGIAWLCAHTAPSPETPDPAFKKPFAVKAYERTEMPFRSAMLIVLLHVLDRRGFIDLYPKKKKRQK